MEEEKSDESPKKQPAKPSLTLSWVTLGFVVGVIFIRTLPDHRAEAPPALAPAPVPVAAEPVRPSLPPQFTTIEAVFEQWGHYAVWEDDVTEVALWNSEVKRYANCFEVLRSGGNNYFRSIPHLTRPVLTHGVPAGAPLAFTEPVAQREEWLGQKSQADLQILRNAILTGRP